MPLTHAQFIAKGHGKTAPWIDLVNSEEWDTFGKRTEWLDDRSWRSYFLHRWGFAAAKLPPFPVEEFKSLRGVLRGACESLFVGRRITVSELRRLNAALNVPGARVVIQRGNALRVEFDPIARGWEWILAQIALSFVELAASANADRIRICLNGDCRWVFYDATKGRTRRWCSDKVCGNRERVRRSRARATR